MHLRSCRYALGASTLVKLITLDIANSSSCKNMIHLSYLSYRTQLET